MRDVGDRGGERCVVSDLISDPIPRFYELLFECSKSGFRDFLSQVGSKMGFNMGSKIGF